MTRIQRQALRELKQRNKYHQRCERERSRHNQRMNAPQLLPRVAVAWLERDLQRYNEQRDNERLRRELMAIAAPLLND